MDYNTNDGSLTKIIITDKDGTKTGEYYLNNEKVDKDKVDIYIKKGENYVIEEDINNIIFSYTDTKGKLIFTFSFVTEENDHIEITYDLSLDELQSDAINRYYTDKDYAISFILDGSEVKITLTKSDGTSTTYTIVIDGTGIRHQP